jgi:hypothetical protein
VYEQLRREAAALGMPVTRLVEDRLLGRRTPTEELLAMAERVRQLEEMTGLRSKTG